MKPTKEHLKKADEILLQEKLRPAIAQALADFETRGWNDGYQTAFFQRKNIILQGLRTWIKELEDYGK